jgi:hypothetical protein
MLTKIVLAAALVVGAAAAAQAGSRDDYGCCGGYHVGPMGQWFGGPAYRGRYWGAGPYAYAPYAYAPYDDDYGYAYVPAYPRYWRYYR